MEQVLSMSSNTVERPSQRMRMFTTACGLHGHRGDSALKPLRSAADLVGGRTEPASTMTAVMACMLAVSCRTATEPMRWSIVVVSLISMASAWSRIAQPASVI